MASGIAAKCVAPILQYVDVIYYSPIRSLLLGAGFAYAINEEKYHHVPLTLVFPSVYAGYQSYKNRDAIINFFRQEKLK